MTRSGVHDGASAANDESDASEASLGGREIHVRWESDYRTPQNERFFDEAFDRLTSLINPPGGSTFLDAGCGPGFHTIRLARRGFRVQAVDFSEAALEMARKNVTEAGLDDLISLQRENLVSLSFADGSFDYVLCWGVLMHIPNVASAIAELCRVLRPGGVLVVSEGNMHSLDDIGLRVLARTRRRKTPRVRVPAGLESRSQTPAGLLVTRRADIGWLTQAFEEHGLRRRWRLPGQFTEAYVKTGASSVTTLLHRINGLLFRFARTGKLAAGNILVLDKPTDVGSR